MGGIVAAFSRSAPISGAALTRAVQRLRHRGPDGEACWIAGHGRIGLGATRLATHDLAGDAQPSANEDGRIRAVFDGELYDAGQVRRELEERGHRFATGGDGEVLVHLYEEWGTQCVHKLRGDFAFVLWDEANGLLFAARDRFGVKPLFYAEAGGVLHLASEAKALFAAGVPAGWDREAVFQQLFVCLDEDRSLFRDVYQIPAGHSLLASRHHTRISRYWDLDYPLAGGPRTAPEEIIEELRAALAESIRLRTRADVPVAFFLSGGVDSSTVLGMAASQSAEPLNAFTVTFEGTPWDEGPVARETTARAGAVFHPLQVTDEAIAENLADAVWHGEMLGLNTHGVARYIQCRQVRAAGYPVVLSGEGSDDIFAGYPSAKQDSLLGAAPQRAAAAGPGVLLSDGTPRQLLGISRALGFAPAWLRKVALGRSVFHALLAPGLAQEFAERDPYRVFLDRCDVRGQVAAREPVIQALYLWMKAFLGTYALCAERLQMAHAVEERLPFLDHHVFDVVRRVPADLLVHGLREKHILREAARPFLTDTVYRRPKHSFTAPPVLAQPGSPLHALAQDLLRSQARAASPLFDQGAVVALLDRLPDLPDSTRVALDAILLMIVSASVLEDRYRLC
jgi:asparagine synthase (glutamine-hydrolysing)